jgi:putative phosphoribosyl transferase
MQTTMDVVFQDRARAGYLLSKQLDSYRNTNAVVVGITRGGVRVAFEIAKALSLPLETIIYGTMLDRKSIDNG